MNRPTRQNPRSPETASALLVVLWALVLLSAAIFAWSRWIYQDIQINGNANRVLEARAMAHSGVAVALNPAVKKQTPLLNEELGLGRGYSVRIVSEGGKLNINWLIQGEEPRKLAIFKQWLEMRGLNFREREVFVDCLLDYVDPDNIHRLNGVEDESDYHAANRPLQSVDEIQQVRGAAPLLKSPGWKDSLTVESSGQGIDILAATPELLRLIPGIGEARIQRLMTYRQGKDGVEGTADDFEFQNLNQVLVAIGLGPAEQGALNGLVMINDPVVRILSKGYSAKVNRQVEVVARKTGQNPPILSWKE